MWISKRKYQNLEKRVADLEGQVQSQQLAEVKLNISDRNAYNLVIKNNHKRSLKHCVGWFDFNIY